jgi:hypothetical protein
MPKHLDIIFDEIAQFNLIELGYLHNFNDNITTIKPLLFVLEYKNLIYQMTFEENYMPIQSFKWYRHLGAKYKIYTFDNNVNANLIFDIYLNYCKNITPTETKLLITFNQSTNVVEICDIKNCLRNKNLFILTNNFDELQDYLNRHEPLEKIILF